MALKQLIIDQLNVEVDADMEIINRITTLLRELLVDEDEREARNSAVFIAKKTQRLLWAVPAVPDISGGRPAYQGVAPR
ncbi:hypothetical protein Tco_0922823 [Tanacetum coccineum]|uniref:Uncharacterized protein n=1 Tax=Tanacetum coccineum TaxID=301880 RepID=A0ABQ5D078_9ASTR